MADYDLGRAHGRIVIDYDDKAAHQAVEDFESVGESAESLADQFGRVGGKLRSFFRNWSDQTTKFARNAGLIAGVGTVLVSLTGMFGKFGGSVLKLRGGLGIISALSLSLGGLPKSVQGFPKIIKQIILLSSAITLFSASSGLIANLVSRIPILQRLAPAIRSVGDGANYLGRHIHTIARTALLIGALKSGISTAKQLAKALSILGAVNGGLSVLLVTVGALAGAIGQLSGVIGLLPGAVIAAIVPIGVLALGMMGFKEALKNMGDIDKFNESIKDLAPSAHAAAVAIRELRGPFREIQRFVQERLFDQLSGEIRTLAVAYWNVLSTNLALVASQINNVVRQFSSFLRSKQTVRDVAEALVIVTTFLNGIAAATFPVANGLRDIGIVSLQAFGFYTAGIASAAMAFEAWAARIRADGSLRAWIDRGVEGVKLFIQIVGNIAGIFDAIFGNLIGSNPLQSIADGTQQLETILRSSRAQEVIGNIITVMQTLATVSRSVLSAAIEQLGPILAALMPFIIQVSKAFGVVLVGAINTLGPILLKVAQFLSLIAPVAGPVLGVLLGLGIAAKALGIAWIFLGRAMAILSTGMNVVIAVFKVLRFLFISNPWIGIAIALVALVIFIITHWEQIKGYLITAWNFIKAWAVRIWTGIASFFSSLWSGVSSFFVSVWNGIKNFLIGLWQGIITTAHSVWNGIVSVFTTVSNAIRSIITTVWDGIKAYFQSWFNVISTIFRGALTVLQAVWNGFWSVFGDFFKAVWNLITALFMLYIAVIRSIILGFVTLAKAAWELLWNAVIAKVINALTIVKNFIMTALGIVIGVMQRAWQLLVAATSATWDAIRSVTLAVWGSISGWISGIVNGILTRIRNAWNAISSVTSAVWRNITDFVSGHLSALSAIVSSVLNRVKSTIQNAWNAVRSATNSAWQGIKDAISSAIGVVMGLVGDIPGRILRALGNMAGLLFNKGKEVVQGFIDGITSMINAAAGAIRRLTNMLPGSPVKEGPLTVLNRARKLLAPHGTQLIEGLVRSFGKEIPKLEAMLNATVNAGVPSAANFAMAGTTRSVNNVTNNAGSSNTVNVYNPKTEPASDSLSRTLRKFDWDGDLP